MSALSTSKEAFLDTSSIKWGYAIGIGLTVLASVITGLDWQSGLTLALVFAYITLLLVRIEWGIYAILAFAVLCIDGWAPTRSADDVVFRLALGRIYIMELAVYILLAFHALRRWFQNDAGGEVLSADTPLSRPFLVLAGLLPIYALFGFMNGYALQDAFGYYEWRALFMAIVFGFLVSTILNTPRKAASLLTWLVGIIAIKGVYSLVLYGLHSNGLSAIIFGTGPVDEGPENYMFVISALTAAAMLFFSKEKSLLSRTLLAIAAAIPVLNVVLSEKRNPQMGLLIGGLLLLWKLPFKQKLRLALASAFVFAIILLVGMASGSSADNGGLQRSASRYHEIAEFIQAPQEFLSVRGGTLSFHLLDLADALNVIRQHPILGYGFGGSYDRVLTLLPGAGGAGAGLETGMVHSLYLQFWWKMGLPGLLVFLWFVIANFQLGKQLLSNRPSSPYAAMALGLCVAVWADAVMEIWGPSWIGGTKYPLVLFTVVALLTRLAQPHQRIPARPRVQC